MFWKFGKFFPKLMKKIYVNFEKYFEKYCRNFWALFRKISKIIAKNLENNFVKFCELYRKFSKIIFKKFWRFRKILRTYSRSISENVFTFPDTSAPNECVVWIKKEPMNSKLVVLNKSAKSLQFLPDYVVEEW